MYGVTQPVNAPASTRHWNVDAASEEVNVKVETWELVSPDGPLVMMVSATRARGTVAGTGGIAVATGATARADSVGCAAVAGGTCTTPIEKATASIATPQIPVGRMRAPYAA